MRIDTFPRLRLIAFSLAAATLDVQEVHARERVAGANMTECVHYDASARKFHNRCTKDVELYWVAGDGWSQATLRARDWRQNFHPGAVVEFYACLPGQNFDRASRECYFWE